MGARRNPLFLIGSVLFHGLIFLALTFGFEFSNPLPVIQNTNKEDIISAVILGESPDSKILPVTAPVTKPVEAPKEPPPKQKPKPTPPPDVKPDTIVIKSDLEKKLLEQQVKVKKKQETSTNELLADIKKQTKKQKAVQQKQLQSHFEKTLKLQAEKTMRQLLDEEVMLQGKEQRQASGEINKYKALILQAISEQWIVPGQANRRLFCELKIRLAPSGLVLEVQVTKSSGDRSLDSSARAAVLKASPLPVPKDKVAFEPFREFVLKVRPENILTGSI